MAERAAVGITVKSGWACAVVIGGSPASPRVLDIRRLELSDPARPEARQPYHDGFGTARREGPALARLVASVERFGSRTMDAALADYTAAHRHLCGVGIVVGSLIDPETLGSSHVRIHALEGRLFRTIVSNASERAGLGCVVYRERDLLADAASTFDRSPSRIRETLNAMGRSREGAWRAEHKAAALAGWMMLEVK
jgi:hypothetical protein